MGAQQTNIHLQDGLSGVSRSRIEKRAMTADLDMTMPTEPPSIDSRFRALKRLGEVHITQFQSQATLILRTPGKPKLSVPIRFAGRDPMVLLWRLKIAKAASRFLMFLIL